VNTPTFNTHLLHAVVVDPLEYVCSSQNCPIHTNQSSSRNVPVRWDGTLWK